MIEVLYESLVLRRVGEILSLCGPIHSGMPAGIGRCLFRQIVPVEGLEELNRELRKEVDTGPKTVILVVADRYWNYMLKQSQMYRLVNGLDGVPVDNKVLGAAVRGVCEITEIAIGQWLNAQRVRSAIVDAPAVDELTDAVWALLHGMASLYLGRAARLDSRQAGRAVLQLLLGAVSPSEGPLH